MSSDFCYPLRVFLEDTDAGGIVFYANYLKFFERARTECVRTAGFEMRKSLEAGISFVVADLSIKYRRSARLDDELNIFVHLLETKNTYFVVKQWVELKREPGERLVEGQVKVACVDLESGRPSRLPESLKVALNSLS